MTWLWGTGLSISHWALHGVPLACLLAAASRADVACVVAVSWVGPPVRYDCCVSPCLLAVPAVNCRCRFWRWSCLRAQLGGMFRSPKGEVPVQLGLVFGFGH